MAVALLTGVALVSQAAAAGASTTGRHIAGVRLDRMAPRIPVGAAAIGPVSRSTLISLSISLAPRDEAALTDFIAAASMPGSAAYHHYLPAGQFAERFGPSARTIAAVESQLRSFGMARPSVSSDHLLVTTHATAATVESSLGVHLERYRLRDGSVGFVNTQAPLVTGVLASPAVEGILGLDSLARPRPLLYHQRTTPHLGGAALGQ
ncbi:MAG TPA: protease pro-enzyme activation domain-containing protein, partial [Acidimicrobiales bacterium]|nr:protease pro-enzyme activation domain-containing protein [Acidimicrobiales bacterium]